jgi:hypothetical protein
VAVAAGAIAVSAFAVQVGLGAFGDAAAPAAPLISSAPLRPTISTRATLAFDRVFGLSYECSLDGGVYASCNSPVGYRPLSRSVHVFRVRARKPGGATSAASAYSWTVVAPRRRVAQAHVRWRPIMTTAPVLPSVSPNATLAWLLKPSTTGQCRLDRGRWKRCASPKTFLGLALGRHVFRVRATLANGHRSSVNRFEWTILASPPPPPPTIGSHPDGATSSTDATFTFDVAAGSAAECRLDMGPWQSCSSPVLYVGLGLGSHTFCVRAVGPDGVTGSQTCFNWSVVGSGTTQAPGPSGPFFISGGLPSLLYPGGGAFLPLKISNPFSFDLRVTSLQVTVFAGSSMTGCDGPTNLQVTQSNTAGGAVSVLVPANGSLTLPAQGATAPFVEMLDLPTDQDACKNAVFDFSYSGQGTQS